MKTFSVLLAVCQGIHRWQVGSPNKGQWRWALIFNLICAWTNGLANNRDVADLWRNRAHCYVNVMDKPLLCLIDGVVCTQQNRFNFHITVCADGLTPPIMSPLCLRMALGPKALGHQQTEYWLPNAPVSMLSDRHHHHSCKTDTLTVCLVA